MGALDELLAKWRENPDSGTTLALCTYLGTSRREDLIREVGSTAEAWHKEDPLVMLAVGRMYLDSGLLQEAQAALVAAGKVAQQDAAPYRYLGEVLLRRGDATRAEKVLARALQIGGTGAAADTRMWHDRAVVHIALQTRVGMRAVADEIARTVAKKMSIPAPSLSTEAAEVLAQPSRRVARPLVPPPPKRVSSLPPPPEPLPSFRPLEDSEGDTTGRFEVQGPPPMPSRDQLATIVTDATPPTVPPMPGPKTGRSKSAPRAGIFDDSPRPSSETVLEHLARVGIYDKGGGAAPAWASPPRDKSRGTWFLSGAMLVLAGLGFGGYRYVGKVRAQKKATALRIEADVRQRLETGKIDDLKKTDGELSQVFDLDSRSEQAAILWLRNRVLSTLMLPGEPRGIESAMARCRAIGIDESKIAFGKIASFLAEGDLAGAAAILPKWDEKAKGDAFYELTAAAMLERAGDVRAIGRYQQAFDADPELSVARVFHAALVTLELGVETGKPLIEDTVKRIGDGPVARALTGLVWAFDPAAGDLPDTARVPDAERGLLPTGLVAIPSLVDARVAVRAGNTTEALAALDRTIGLTATPAMACGVGQMAIDLGDEPLARKATLRALSFSAVYPRARSLAARVALLGGHIDEAKKAIEELDAKSPEVAVVRAVAAYEALDPSGLDSAVSQIGSPDGAGRALAAGSGIAMGEKYPPAAALSDMATPSVPWGDLIAVDAALDTGNMELAEKIAGTWGDRGTTPTYALRLSRLYRYQGKPEAAAKASADAVVRGGVTPRVLVERFLSLTLDKDSKGARDLLARYPAVLGPLTDFLKISLDTAEGKAARGKAVAARLEPPPEGSPLLYELIAARGLVDVGDRRAKPLVAALHRQVPKHPDVIEMAKAVGIAK